VGDIARLVELLVDPVSGKPLHRDGDALRAADGRSFPIRSGIPRFVGSLDDGQRQTSDTFGFKWAKTETYDSPEVHDFALAWMLERYGFASALEAREYFEAGAPFLDLGCGGGLTASLWMDRWQGAPWVGVDISDAIDVASRRLPEGPGMHFVQADAMALPFRAGTFRTVFSEGVLHHTPSTRAALAAAAAMLAPGGEIMFYVYRRKSPVREFTDDYVRERLSDLSPEEAWAALRPLTRLGEALAELHATVELQEGVPLLGIPAGRFDVQRLIYWHFAKLFWNDTLSFETNNHLNFDWYTPRYAHRQTEEEVRAWCADLGLTIERFHVDDAGYTVRARSRADSVESGGSRFSISG
jgi:arsenite methyltransferase